MKIKIGRVVLACETMMNNQKSLNTELESVSSQISDLEEEKELSSEKKSNLVNLKIKQSELIQMYDTLDEMAEVLKERRTTIIDNHAPEGDGNFILWGDEIQAYEKAKLEEFLTLDDLPETISSLQDLTEILEVVKEKKLILFPVGLSSGKTLLTEVIQYQKELIEEQQKLSTSAKSLTSAGNFKPAEKAQKTKQGAENNINFGRKNN